MSGGGGSQNTVTQSVQIPAYEQQYSEMVQNNAQNISSQAYPQYQAPLQANFTPQELQAFEMAGNAATAQNPYNADAAAEYWAGNTQQGAAESAIGQGVGQELSAIPYQQQDAAYQAAGAGLVGQGANTLNYAESLNPGNASALSQYMSPYVQQALAPQILQMETQLGQQQNATAAQATSAGAFGDARQGVSNSLNNYYGDQTLAGIEATGYNTAYTNALSSLNQQQQNVIGIGTEQGTMGNELGTLGANTGAAGMNLGTLGTNLGTLGSQISQVGVNQANIGNDWATLGNTAQQEALTGANATYDAGQIQQNQTQQALNLAYEQYQNQVQWPYQMQNVMESALSNSPYNIVNQTTLPNAGMSSALGSFASTAGSLGSLLSGSTGAAGTTAGSPTTPGPL